MREFSVFHQLLVFLLAPVSAVPLLRWLRSSPIVGYLVAGILIGPHALGLIVDLQLGAIVLAATGTTPEEAARTIDEFRRNDSAGLDTIVGEGP